MFEHPRLLSRPMGVEWAGWRTDTHRLQQAGWELAVEFEIYRHTYRLLMRHRMMRLHALTDALSLENHIQRDYNLNLANVPVFNVIGVAPSIETLRVPDVSFTAFQQIDAQPQMSMARVERVEDINIFAVPLTRTQEILVDKADMTVIEHLEAIKRLQSPEQQAIRERILREGAMPPGASSPTARQHVIAQLVHLAA
jgi:hypothetical protein